MWYNIKMVNAPQRAPESPGEAAEETASSFLARMAARFERPSAAANDNAEPGVMRLAQRTERLNQTEAEGSWLQRNVIDWFSTRTETRAELHTHSAEVGQDLSMVSEDVGDIVAVWEDDRQLRRRIDQYERYNRQYGDQARHVVESQIEGLGETEEVELGVIDENSTPEEIAEIEAQQEENRLRQASIERWEQFAEQDQPGGRWRARRLTQSALSWQNIKDNWQNRTSFFSFFSRMGADIAQWRAVRSAVPAVNVVSYGVREGQEVIETYRETGETIAEGAELVMEGRQTQREVQREGAETVVLASEGARSDYIRNQVLRLMRGEVSRTQVLASTRAAFSRFERQDPQAFARMVRGYGLTARSLNTKAGFYELFKNAALWYTPWGDRGERSFWEANETAVPIWGSYAAWRDIGVDNGLPLWSRIGFATVGTALDIGTVLSFGTLTPILAGGKAAMVKGSQALARRLAQRGAQGSVTAGARTGARSLGQLMAGLPRAARRAVTNTGARATAMGVAGYTALSAGIDWLFDLEDRAVDLALVAAERAVGYDLSYQQRRLLRVVGQDVEPVLQEAYEDYREERRPETDVEEEAVALMAENEATPALTDGQIAEDEARRAAA